MKPCQMFLLVSAVSLLSLLPMSAQDSAGPLQASAATGRGASVLTHPDCGKSGLARNLSTCEEHAGVFNAGVNQDGQGHRTLVYRDLQTWGPATSLASGNGWTVTHVVEAPHIVFGTRGIDQYEGVNAIKNGVGDMAGLYLYVHGGGRSTQADEGVTGITVESGEINGYFHGTISGNAGRGATSLTLANDAKAPHDWGYTCDGCMLLDISKGTIAGSLNGASTQFGSTYLNQLPTTNVTVAGSPGSLPITRARCSTTTAIPPTATAGTGTSRTISCTLGAVGGVTRAFTAGGVVTIAGQYYPEQATLTSVGEASGGVQSLTLLARNPNPAGSVIFQGGIAGQSLSFDDNLAATGFRSSYYVFGSVDGVNLIYGNVIAGNVARNTLPRQNLEAETTSSGFHLYPSAEIVANTSQPSAPLLEPNAVDWQPGDVVENPRFQSYGGWGIRDECQQFTPTDGSGSAGCMAVSAGGTGVSGAYNMFRIQNLSDQRQYRQFGGSLEPVPVMRVSGIFGSLMQFHSGPSKGASGYNSVIDIQSTANRDNTPFYLFTLPSGRGSGAAQVLYDPATLHINFPQGVVTGSLGTTQNCAAIAAGKNCAQASAGSFVLPAGAQSVTVNTSAVTADSQIQITPDASLDARLGVTCNKTPASAFAPYGIVARVPGRGFTLAVAGGAAGGGPNCYSFTIIN